MEDLQCTGRIQGRGEAAGRGGGLSGLTYGMMTQLSTGDCRIGKEAETRADALPANLDHIAERVVKAGWLRGKLNFGKHPLNRGVYQRGINHRLQI